jgi:hypothetical protein
MTVEPTTPPIVCDMTGAPDTAVERLDTYAQLFADALIGRERTDDGVRFRFRADDGIEQRVHDLAALEKACCAFFEFSITVHGNEVWWDSTTIDDPIAHKILDQMYALPDTVNDGGPALFDRFAEPGLVIITKDNGVVRPATSQQIGITHTA